MRIAITTLLILSSLKHNYSQILDTLERDDTLANIEEIQDGLDALHMSWFDFQEQVFSEIAEETNNTLYAIGKDSLRTVNNTIIVHSDSLLKSRLFDIPTAIPLTYNTRVRNLIDFYLTSQRVNLEKLIGVGKYYYLPLIEPIVDELEMPDELKYLPAIESAFKACVVSHARAVGLWQFMYYTAKQYKLTINSLIDERCDPVKSSYAALRYLKDLYNTYNDWYLAIAAYNCGPGNVNKAIRRSGGSRNVWKIYPYLPRETRGYVPSFIAAVYLFNHYSDYKVIPQQIIMPRKDSVILTSRIHMKQITEVLQLDEEVMEFFNPQLRTGLIPASSTKPFSLVLPARSVLSFLDMEDSIRRYKAEKYLKTSQYTMQASSRGARLPKPPGTSPVYHKVEEGDNIGFIAMWYDVSASSVRSWNNIRRNLIRVGQKLTIYVPQKKLTHYQKIAMLSQDERLSMINKESLGKQEQLPQPTTTSGKITYRVKKGDSLWSISQKFNGVSIAQIKKLNNMQSNGLKVGQVLVIR